MTPFIGLMLYWNKTDKCTKDGPNTFYSGETLLWCTPLYWVERTLNLKLESLAPFSHDSVAYYLYDAIYITNFL